MKMINLQGLKFGRLKVKEFAGTKNNIIRWWVKCDCGVEKTIIGTHLTRKVAPTKSCGCYQKERSSETHKKHGMRNTLFYNAWARLKCEHPNGYVKKWEKFENFYKDIYKSYLKNKVGKRMFIQKKYFDKLFSKNNFCWKDQPHISKK